MLRSRDSAPCGHNYSTLSLFFELHYHVAEPHTVCTMYTTSVIESCTPCPPAMTVRYSCVGRGKRNATGNEDMFKAVRAIWIGGGCSGSKTRVRLVHSSCISTLLLTTRRRYFRDQPLLHPGGRLVRSVPDHLVIPPRIAQYILDAPRLAGHFAAI